MRRVVVLDELLETEIRPRELLERYYALSETESRSFFQPEKFSPISCPFCDAEEHSLAFSRWSFQYQECVSCGSLYVSPRPSRKRLDEFRRQSEAGAVWRSVIEETSRRRDERVFLPRLEWVANLVAERFQEPVPCTDWGSRSLAYLKEISRIGLFSSVGVFEPDPSIAEDCVREGWSVSPRDIPENLRSCGAVTAFDVVNGRFSPQLLLQTASDILRPGALLFLTGRSAGFELQLLWENAHHLHPLDHMNLPSVEGLSQVLAIHGFEPVELSTPGRLDMDMVTGAGQADPSLPLPRWLRYLMEKRGRSEQLAFQEFLQRARLSSHFRVAAQKVTDSSGGQTT